MNRRYSTRKRICASRNRTHARTVRRNIMCSSHNFEYGYVSNSSTRPYLNVPGATFFRDYYETDSESHGKHMRDMDGLIIYNGYVYSAFEVENMAWSDYEELQDEDPEIIGDREFDEFLADEAENILYDLNPEAEVIDSTGGYTTWKWIEY